MIGALLLAAAAPATATLPGPDSRCELHLFALDIGAGPQPKGNLLVRPLPASDDRLAFVNVVSPQDRMADLDDGQYRAALGLAGDAPVVRHWDIPVDANVRKSTVPLFPTPGRCHLELAGYSSSGFAPGRSRSGKAEVYINLLLRSFDAAGALTFKVDKGGATRVETEKKVGRDAALASLQDGSVAILDDFAKDVAKARSQATKTMKKDIR